MQQLFNNLATLHDCLEQQVSNTILKYREILGRQKIILGWGTTFNIEKILTEITARSFRPTQLARPSVEGMSTLQVLQQCLLQ